MEHTVLGIHTHKIVQSMYNDGIPNKMMAEYRELNI